MKTKIFFALCVFAGLIFGCGGKSNDTPIEKDSTIVELNDNNTFIDPRDGQTYRIVEMPDGKTWMAQNLNFETASGSWCYDDDIANCNVYGRLYDWDTARRRRVCPYGWRLPDTSDWGALESAVGGWETAGTKLKSKTGWEPYSGVPAGTDDFGFSALPGGRRWHDGSFIGLGLGGFWWTATEYGLGGARFRYIHYYDDESVGSEWDLKNAYFSVRCIRKE